MPAFVLVMLDEELPKPLPEWARVLAKALGRVSYDVIAAINRNPYFPLEGLSREEAEEAVAVLAGRGIRAAAVPAGKLPPAVRFHYIRNADVEDQGLSVQIDLAGRKLRLLPWTEIEALAAATLNLPLDSPAPAAAGPSIGRMAAQVIMPGYGGIARAMRPPQPPRERKPRWDRFMVLALLPAGAPMELRFRADQFNYDYLGARLAPTGAANFRTFVADVAGRATRARLSPAVRELVASGKAPPEADAGRFQACTRWLALLARAGLGGPGGA